MWLINISYIYNIVCNHFTVVFCNRHISRWFDSKKKVIHLNLHEHFLISLIILNILSFLPVGWIWMHKWKKEAKEEKLQEFRGYQCETVWGRLLLTAYSVMRSHFKFFYITQALWTVENYRSIWAPLEKKIGNSREIFQVTLLPRFDSSLTKDKLKFFIILGNTGLHWCFSGASVEMT